MDKREAGGALDGRTQEGGETGRSASGAWAWFGVVAVAIPVTFLYLSCFKHALIDDAFITLQYAKTLRDHGHWGFFADATTNSATSPLNVLLTAAVGVFVPRIVDAAIWLATTEVVLLVLVLFLISRRVFDGHYFGVVSSVTLITNPLVLSTIGLESLLYVSLVTASICLFLFEKWRLLAVCLALLTLTRPDGVLLFVVLLIFANPPAPRSRPRGRSRGRKGDLIQPRPANRRLGLCGWYLACLMPWYFFSWIHLGSVLPDTFFFKVASPWGNQGFLQGPLFYFRRYPLETVFSFPLLLFAPLLLFGSNQKAKRVGLILALYGGAYFGAYTLLNVAPYHWYFVPLAAVAALLGALGLSSLYCRGTARARLLTRLPFYTVPLLPVCGIIVFFVRADALRLREAPIHTNWATHDQYKEIGLWLREHVEAAENIRLRGEIGTLAFYSERRLMNRFSCRHAAQPTVRRFDTLSPAVRFLSRINFYWFQPGEPCGPYTAELRALTRAVDANRMATNVVQSWSTSSRWVRNGTVFLAR